MALFDPIAGRFYAGTVPPSVPASAGIKPDGPQKGNDVTNTFDFLDAQTFTTLTLARSPLYRNAIDWRQPIQWMLDHFGQSITASGQKFQGFNLVTSPTSGPNGIAWEFTGQAVVAMRFVDFLYGQRRFADQAQFYLDQIRNAQQFAPFGDGQGLVAATMQDGEQLPPYEQCLSTPFQCIGERIGLAATTWAIFAELNMNPFEPKPFARTLADFNGDGMPDILWRDSLTGEVFLWFMNGITRTGGSAVDTVPDANWKIVGAADFNSDGKADLLWRNSLTGENRIWFMDGVTHGSDISLDAVPDTNWRMVGAADFNGDGKADLLWHNSVTGDNYVWFMDGITHLSGSPLDAVPDKSWEIAGVADFNRDGTPDIVWHNIATGENYVWLMSGITRVSGSPIEGSTDTNWRIVGIAGFNP
jgi:hypothetical protein